MQYALIDVGSNSIRLCIYQCEDGRIERLLSQKETAGLAGYVQRGMLDVAGIDKACEAISRLADIALKFVDRSALSVFATASLRNIRNRRKAVKAVEERTGLSIHVLEGEREAELAFTGAMRYARHSSGILMDIGGGSTELVLFEDYRPKKLASMPIGCLNLFTQYCHGAFPGPKERRQMKRAILTQLDGLGWEVSGRYPLIVGVGGTVRGARELAGALFSLEEDALLSLTHVRELLRMIKDEDTKIYKTIYKQIPERTLTITSGLLILRHVMEMFGGEELFVSQFGVREGYLIEYLLDAPVGGITDAG